MTMNKILFIAQYISILPSISGTVRIIKQYKKKNITIYPFLGNEFG